MEMCEPGTDKCICPDCPGTCQGYRDKRDYAADLEICEKATPEPWEMVKANSEGPYLIRMPYPKDRTWYGVRMIAWEYDAQFIVLARPALPWYIRKVMELESQKAFATAHENNIRQKHGLSPDVSFGDLAKYRDSLQAEVVRLREALEYVEGQILGDYYEHELSPLHRAIIDTVKEALSPSPAADKVIQASEAWDKMNGMRKGCTCGECGSPAADRWKAMERVVAAVHKHIGTGGYVLPELINALDALEKAGELK